MRHPAFLLVVILLLSSSLYAQRSQGDLHFNREAFSPIDLRVARMGPMPDHTVGAIVKKLTDTSWTQVEKLRALYMWEILHVSFDCKAYRYPRNYQANAAIALNKRKTTSQGYALFFKALCDVAGIQCEVVSGLLRTDAGKIGVLETQKRHYWNVATIDNVRFLIDATLGAGTVDEQRRVFIKDPTDVWWMAKREIFVLSHFPDKKELQLLKEPITQTAFANAPIAGTNALLLGIVPRNGINGILRGRQDTVVALEYTLQRPTLIRAIGVSIDEEAPVPIDYKLDVDGKHLVVFVPYKKPGKQSYYLYVNDNQVLAYQAVVRMYKSNKAKNSTKH